MGGESKPGLPTVSTGRTAYLALKCLPGHTRGMSHALFCTTERSPPSPCPGWNAHLSLLKGSKVEVVYAKEARFRKTKKPQKAEKKHQAAVCLSPRRLLGALGRKVLALCSDATSSTSRSQEGPGTNFHWPTLKVWALDSAVSNMVGWQSEYQDSALKCF
jgi:hypothetical protein